MKDGYAQGLDDLIALKHARKSVVWGWGRTHRPIPAAVVLNMTGLTINGAINRGLKVHELVAK